MLCEELGQNADQRGPSGCSGCGDPTLSLDLEVLASLHFNSSVASLGTKAALPCSPGAVRPAGGAGPGTSCHSADRGVETQPQGRACGTWPYGNPTSHPPDSGRADGAPSWSLAGCALRGSHPTNTHVHRRPQCVFWWCHRPFVSCPFLLPSTPQVGCPRRGRCPPKAAALRTAACLPGGQGGLSIFDFFLGFSYPPSVPAAVHGHYRFQLAPSQHPTCPGGGSLTLCPSSVLCSALAFPPPPALPALHIRTDGTLAGCHTHCPQCEERISPNPLGVTLVALARVGWVSLGLNSCWADGAVG